MIQILMILFLVCVSGSADEVPTELRRQFPNSYALVIGIDNYLNKSAFTSLESAEADARAVTRMLETQGFVVRQLLGNSATKSAIEAEFEDYFANNLQEGDRIIVYIAGHAIRRVGREASGTFQFRGYIVPYDGDSSYSTLIPMTRVHDWSDLLQLAVHQVFILDTCFSGLAANRDSTINPDSPYYFKAITSRRARQLLTSGGVDQRVVDTVSGGHSLFATHFLKAIEKGLADSNGDGYVTFTEISSYVQRAASSPIQTPGNTRLSGDQAGDFIFFNPVNFSARDPIGIGPSVQRGLRGSADVYGILESAFHAYESQNYRSALSLFLEAAELGNAEAMKFAAIMYSKGEGVPKSENEAVLLFKASADRGDVESMRYLIQYYQSSDRRDVTEAARWSDALSKTVKINQRIKSFTLAAGPVLVLEETNTVTRPKAPTGLRIIP